uniref:Uncharacterized protein n=1 Tax=Tanacetum cinerariifolium TaxID=118510 RepID=A0A699GYN6_TANCI|nr:hypothetical protein [Tanacetum cinerariifolium]
MEFSWHGRSVRIYLETKKVLITTPSDLLSKKYKRLKATLEELGIRSSLPVPRQVLSLTSSQKRKHQELELEVRIIRHEYNISLPKGVTFVNYLVIEHLENELFFIDVFGDEAFQRMNDIHKVDVDTVLTYLVMASNESTPVNQMFCLALRSLIDNHPDKEKLKSKKVSYWILTELSTFVICGLCFVIDW